MTQGMWWDADLPGIDAHIVKQLKDGKIAEAGDFARMLAHWLTQNDRGVAYTPGHGWLVAGADGMWESGEHHVRAAAVDLADVLRAQAGRYLHGDYSEDGKPDTTAAKALDKAALRLVNYGFVRAMVGMLDSVTDADGERVRRDTDEFDADPDLLAAEDGAGGYLVIELRTGKTRPLNVADKITTAVPTVYDTEAKAERWERFISEVLVTPEGEPDPETGRYFQQLIGYAITGYPNRESVLPLLVGKGSNGKSLAMETLRHVLGGRIAATAQYGSFTQQQRDGSGPSSDLARLVNARLVHIPEGSEDMLATGLVKQLTGGEPITARFMRMNDFEYTPKFLPVIVANARPTIKDTDDGIWRRLKVISFRRRFPRDTQLPDVLRAEASGILRWCVAGAVDWYANGLVESATVTRDTTVYRNDEDRLSAFLTERCELDPEANVLGADVYRSYRSWSEDAGVPLSRILGDRSFLRLIREHQDLDTQRSRAGQVVHGLRLLDMAETEAHRREATGKAVHVVHAPKSGAAQAFPVAG